MFRLSEWSATRAWTWLFLAYLVVRMAGPALAEGAPGRTTQFAQSENLEPLAEFSGPVPLEVLVRYALASNPQIQAARYQARALGARVPQVASLPDPQLMTTVFLEQIQTAAGPQEVMMGLSQKLPWFGKLALQSQVAYQEAMAAYARLTAVELGVVEGVKRAYFDLYFLQRAIRETRTLEPWLRDVIETAREKYENNVPGARYEDYLQAEIELSKLKTTLIELKNARIQAQARLAAELHLPPQTPLEAEARIDRTSVTRRVGLLLELTESWQPELEARRREVSRDRSSIALARRDYWPDMTLSFNWQEIGSRGLSPLATGEDAYSLGVGVNLPIYRQRLNAAVREAQYKTSRSVRRYAAAVDQFHAEVQALHAQFLEQDQVLGILESEILPWAEEILEVLTEKYRVGEIAFQQLIDTYRTLLNYRIDLDKREAMREQVVASLERAVGCAVTAWPAQSANQPDAMSTPLPRSGP